MQKPLDPMSVQRIETPSASYVLRRRYGPARYVIAALSRLAMVILLPALSPLAANAGPVTWDNGNSDDVWSDNANWDTAEPTIADDVLFPAGPVGSSTITMGTGELANSLTFNDTYTLASGGDLTLGSDGATDAGKITVAATKTATISSPLYGNGVSQGTSGLTKSGTGTLTLGANDPTFTGAITISAGNIRPFGAGSDQQYNVLGNNRITMAGGSLYLSQPTTNFQKTYPNTREVHGATGTVYARVSMGTRLVWTINALEDATFAGAVNETLGIAANSLSLIKCGPANQTFTEVTPTTGFKLGNTGINSTIHGGALILAGNAVANNSYGWTITTSGALVLDNDFNNNTDRLQGTSNAATLSGGTFKFIGNSSATSTETIDAMTLSGSSGTPYFGYASTVDLQVGNNQNATVTFSTLTRNYASAVNVKYTNNGTGVAGLIFNTTAPTLVNSIVSGMFVNGSDFATHGGAAPATIAALTTYANPASIDSLATTDNALVNNSMTDQQLSGPVSANAMKIDGAQTIDLNGSTLTLGASMTAGMILKTGAGNATISGTSSLIRGSNADFIVRVDQGQLTISSPFSLNGTASVSKSGTGLLILDGTTAWGGVPNYADVLRVQEGAIRVNPGSTVFGSMQRQLAGGVFELTADYAPTIANPLASSCLAWAAAADGGFAAYGAARTVTLKTTTPATDTLTWNATYHVQNGKGLLFNSDTADSKIVMANNIDLAGAAGQLWLREFRVVENTNPAVTTDYAEITGVISGSVNQSHFLKTGPGRLDLSTATSTYEGETIVKEGTLNINGTLAAVSGAGSHGLVTVMSGGTLGGTGTINRPVKVLSGGTLAPGTSIGELAVNDLLLAGGATYAVEIDEGAVGAKNDKTTVTGTVTIGDGTVGGAPVITVTKTATALSGWYVIIDNDGTDAVSGKFKTSGGTLLNDDDLFVSGGQTYTISYDFDSGSGTDGAGNDVALMRATAAPTLTTPTATLIGPTTATLGATLQDDGGDAVSDYGVVWDTNPTSDTGDNKIQKGTTVTPPSTYTVDATGLPAQDQIYYRGYAMNSAGTGYSAEGSFWTEPETQASGVSFPDVQNTSMTITWTAGTGTGRIVLMKKTTAVDASPADGTDSGYAASTLFNGGTPLGTGNYVVYKDSGTSVTVTGLDPGATYHVAVFEYAGGGDNAGANLGINYRTSDPVTGDQTTGSTAVEPVLTSPTMTGIGTTTATLGAYLSSDGGAAVSDYGVVWDTNPNPDTGDNKIQKGTTVTPPSTYTVDATGLPAQDQIYYRGYAVNSAGTGYSDEGSFWTEPGTQASAIQFPNDQVQGTTMRLSWTAGSGAGRIVLVKAGSAVNAEPLDGTDTGYFADAAFGSGTEVGTGTGNYVVYKDNGDAFVNLTGLTPGVTYHAAVFEYAGNGDASGNDKGINYKHTGAPTGSQTTDNVPTLTSPTAAAIGATGATLGANVTAENGDAVTVRGTVWGTSATPTGNAVAEGAGTGPFTHGRSGFTPGQKVYYRGYADNVAGRGYSPDGSFYPEPSDQASGVTFSPVASTSMTISWTAGSGGAGRIVLVKAGSAVDAEPADGTDSGYTANPAFGSGTSINTDNYVVFKGNGTSVNLTGLTPLTTYHVAVFEYAGTGDNAGVNQGINYLQTSPAIGSISTTAGIQYWDTNGDTAGSGNLGGEWSAAAANWNTASSGTGGTLGGSGGESVVFSAGTDGTGSLTISVPASISANNVTIEEGVITLDVANGQTLTFNAGYTLSGQTGLGKAGDGTLLLSANDPTLVGGITISAGNIRPFVGVGGNYNVLGNNRIIMAGGSLYLTQPSTNFQSNSPYTREVSGTTGTVYARVSMGARQSWTINALEDATFAGAVMNNNSDASKYLVMTKCGPANQTFTGTTYPGSTGFHLGGVTSNINGGALVLAGTAVVGNANGWTITTSGALVLDNDSNNNTDRLQGTNSGMTLSGGTFKFIGNSSATSTETIDAMTLSGSIGTPYFGYASTVDLQVGNNQNATVTFSTLTRNYASAVNVKYTNNGTGVAGLVFTTAPALVGNVAIVSGMFVNGEHFATHSGNGTAITPLGTYANPASIDSLIATDNALVDGVTMTDQQLSGAVSANAMKIDGAQTIDLNGSTLTLGASMTSAMILKTSSGIATISGAGNLAHVSNSDYIVRVDAGQLTISSKFSLAGTASVSKSGTGLLVLDGTTAWDGGPNHADVLRVQEGAIRVNPGSTTFGNMQRQLAGGVFELTADYAPTIANPLASSCLAWAAAADGGFAAYGATRTVTLKTTTPATDTLTWNATYHVQNGKALLFNSDTADSKIVMANNIDLAGAVGELWFREFRVAENSNPAVTTDYAEITGVISGSINQSHFLKTGPGRLDLSTATSTYEGETIVKEGRLNVNGTLAAVTGAGSHGLVTVMSGATLGGTGTISRDVRFEAGSAMAVNAAVVNQLTVDGAVTLIDSPALTVVGGPLTEASYTLLTATDGITGTFGTVPEGYVITYTTVGGTQTVKLEIPTGSLFIFR